MHIKYALYILNVGASQLYFVFLGTTLARLHKHGGSNLARVSVS